MYGINNLLDFDFRNWHQFGFGRKNIPLRKKNRGIWNADIHSGVALVCPHTTRNIPNPLAMSMFLSRCFIIFCSFVCIFLFFVLIFLNKLLHQHNSCGMNLKISLCSRLYLHHCNVR